ncbi:MAG: glycosyltransferase family 4 protein [Bdellovibrionota bacterium]
MNILHIDTEKTWRGGENQMRLLMEGLRKHNVTSHAALPPDSEAAKRLQNDCLVFPVYMRGGFALGAALKISKYCRKQHIQVIDAHTANAHTLGLMIKAMLPDLKLIVHRRVDFVPKNNWINRKKYTSSKVDRYVAISQCIKDILISYGIASERIVTVLSAVDPKPYANLNRQNEKKALCQTLSIDPNVLLIGNASAMTPQKGYDVLLRALKELKEAKHSFHCVIAGDGPLRTKLEEMRIALGLEKHLSFLGWIKDVPRFLSALDILALSSNDEGLGTILLEATYAGCTLVASNVGGIPEVVIHRKTGLLSEVGNATQLASNIAQLLQSEEKRQLFRSNAYQHVQEKFSLDAMVFNNLQVYKKALSQDVK